MRALALILFVFLFYLGNSYEYFQVNFGLDYSLDNSEIPSELFFNVTKSELCEYHLQEGTLSNPEKDDNIDKSVVQISHRCYLFNIHSKIFDLTDLSDNYLQHLSFLLLDLPPPLI
ncbi:MAG: hypothetical protein JW894_05095 [Bacteroidales bacterium]|nr:hypothetical protein [Bacteroidales bacterium]